MDWIRVGSSLRALRRRRGWTQVTLAARAGFSRSLVALVEAGEGDRVAGRTLAAICDGVGARLRVQLLWHGENLDRLLDHAHAMLVEEVVRRLERLGWQALPEVTFHVGAGRGSIDILAFHPATGALLVIEVKSVVPDIQAMFAGLDRKARLGARIAAERGLRATAVARLLVLPEAATTRRRVQMVAATLGAAYPARNVAVAQWLRAPAGPLSGVLFLSNVNQGGKRRGAGAESRRRTQPPVPRSSHTSTSGSI